MWIPAVTKKVRVSMPDWRAPMTSASCGKEHGSRPIRKYEQPQAANFRDSKAQQLSEQHAGLLPEVSYTLETLIGSRQATKKVQVPVTQAIFRRSRPPPTNPKRETHAKRQALTACHVTKRIGCYCSPQNNQRSFTYLSTRYLASNLEAIKPVKSQASSASAVIVHIQEYTCHNNNNNEKYLTNLVRKEVPS